MDLMQKIAVKAEKMKIGSWFLTLTKKLPVVTPEEVDNSFQWVLSIKKNMSWGQATVNVHHKVR